MTIGPDPMTRTLLDVCAPGHQAAPFFSVHEVDEAVEEVGGVVRAGRGLRVVLHRERRQVERLQALDDVVVEVDVADHDPAVAAAVVRRDGLAVERCVDREAVVVGRDLDLARGAVHDRLVHAAVAVAQLVGAVAERAAEELVAVADAEERDLAVEHLAQQLDLVRRRRRVARAVGEEDAVRLRWPGRPRWSRSTAARARARPRSASRCGVMALMPRSTRDVRPGSRR